MKDESRANWPEGIKHQEPFLRNDDSGVYKEAICIIINSLNAYAGFSVSLKSRIDLSRDMSEIEARAKQICALPEMVALLKEISEQSLFFENEDGYYETTEFHDTAKAILAEIGEIE